MPNDITYNRILCYANSSITCQNIKKSFVDHNKLILILEDYQKITIAGKNIDTTAHKKRIRELVSMETRKGFDIPEKSVKHYGHYVKEKEIEVCIGEVVK